MSDEVKELHDALDKVNYDLQSKDMEVILEGSFWVCTLSFHFKKSGYIQNTFKGTGQSALCYLSGLQAGLDVEKVIAFTKED